MPFSRLVHTPANPWQGFALRVAAIAIGALLVLGLADWLGVSFDPWHTPRPQQFHDHPALSH